MTRNNSIFSSKFQNRSIELFFGFQPPGLLLRHVPWSILSLIAFPKKMYFLAFYVNLFVETMTVILYNSFSFHSISFKFARIVPCRYL